MIELFNESLNSRYITLERNIKSKSNSFYDSYLDLLEATIKFFLDSNNIKYDESRTCGFIVKTNEVKEFMLNVLMLDDYTYNKILDYIKKCNDHKHKKEKNLHIDSVINYLKVYFDLINYYYDYTNQNRIEFNSDYFISIFGETEKINIEYKNQITKLMEELKNSYETNKLSEEDLNTYKSLLNDKSIELLNIEEQNNYLIKQIDKLKDIKLNSMENKLNKALDMLTELKEFISIGTAASTYAVKLINGKDVTQTPYYNDMMKAMDKKIESNDSLFGKLDSQGKVINNVSDKLQGISINELYALAKRSMDCYDYENAAKYYNQICLLNPLEWEASYLSAICNQNTHTYFYEYSLLPNNYRDIMKSTFEYLDKLSVDDETKKKYFLRAFEITINELKKLRDNFFRYKNDLVRYNFDVSTENLLWFLYKYINKKYDYTTNFENDLLNILCELIIKSKNYSIEINKNEFYEAIKGFSNCDEVMEVCGYISDKYVDIELDTKNCKDIKRNGIKYYKYTNKAQIQKEFISYISIGLILLIISSISIVLSILGNDYYFYNIFFIVTGIIYILKACINKKGYCVDSLFAYKRLKKVKQTNGDILYEKAFSIFSFIDWIGIFIIILLSTFMLIRVIEEYNIFRLISFLLFILNSILWYIYFLMKIINDEMQYVVCYKYNGKIYKI